MYIISIPKNKNAGRVDLRPNRKLRNFSAAKTYGLDFIPVCNEEYDFLIDEKAYGSERVQRFIDALHSDELKERLKKLGGYETWD